MDTKAQIPHSMSGNDAAEEGTARPTHIDISPSKLDFKTGGLDIEEQNDGLISPLNMPPGQIDGLESIQADSYMRGRGQSRKGSATSSLLHMGAPLIPSPAEMAMSAMQYLPYPTMILDTSKTLVMANDAMGRLLGTEDTSDDIKNDEYVRLTDRLRGQSLSQLGIDMLQAGRPVWVNWESFLDALIEDLEHGEGKDSQHHDIESAEGDMTPTAERQARLSDRNRSMVHDAVVEVVLSSAAISSTYFATGKTRHDTVKHTFAKMIITVWELDDENYFTLTFTNTDLSQTSSSNSRVQSRSVTRTAKSSKPHSLTSSNSDSGSHSRPSSVSSGRSSNHGSSSNTSAITSPTSAPMSSSPFPPLGPPNRSSTNLSNAPSSLQKITMMKDALLDNTDIPILAMWKDESLTVPNRAARRLLHPAADLTKVRDGFDLLTRWDVWDDTFSRRLDPSEYPISVLVKTQTAFSSRRIGMYDPDTNEKLVMDCLGEAIRDEDTGEFLAGVLTCRDITRMANEITEIKEKDEQRFKLICESMPQMMWTTTPDGMHDWFSERWYHAIT